MYRDSFALKRERDFANVPDRSPFFPVSVRFMADSGTVNGQEWIGANRVKRSWSRFKIERFKVAPSLKLL